jgi:hypothetical protein
MLGGEMMDLVKERKAESVKGSYRKGARADCLDHGDTHIKSRSYITLVPLYSSDTNPRQQACQFRGPLVSEELLVNDNEKAATDFRCSCNPGEGFAISTGQTDETVATGGAKGGEGFRLMRAEVSPKGEGRR